MKYTSSVLGRHVESWNYVGSHVLPIRFHLFPFVINGRHSNFNALAHCVDNLLGYNSRILEVNLDALTGPYVCMSTDSKYFLFADCELLDL